MAFSGVDANRARTGPSGRSARWRCILGSALPQLQDPEFEPVHVEFVTGQFDRRLKAQNTPPESENARRWAGANLSEMALNCSGAEIADRFDRTSFHGFLALSFFFGSFRLLFHVAVAAIFPASKIVGSGLAAQVAINALVIDKKLAGDVLFVAIGDVGHRIFSG